MSETVENTPPLKALVLAGGKSRRMGEDKAKLVFEGKTLLSHILSLLDPLVEETFISLREGQAMPKEAMQADIAAIYDKYGEIGPAAAILTALEKQPDSAWLVVAVDLPLLDEHTLELLIQERDPSKLATAFLSSTAGHAGQPEPLCAIYEPDIRDTLKASVIEQEIYCPRCILNNLESQSKFIPLRNPKALTNVNTPEEFDRARMKGF